jgi:hypothetical protein
MIGLFVAGCVVHTTRYFISPAAAERITPTVMRDRVNAMMVLECPRLRASRDSTWGAVGIALVVDSAGLVQRASMRRGSGSASLDDVLGALAAQLRLDPQPRARTAQPATRQLAVFYWCSRTAGDVRLQIDSM